MNTEREGTASDHGLKFEKVVKVDTHQYEKVEKKSLKNAKDIALSDVDLVK